MKEILETRADERSGNKDLDPRGSAEDTRKSVIIVDREVMYRGHLRELIEQEGYRALTFYDAYEMVRHIQENDGETRAVFIDSAIFTAIEKTLISMISFGKSRIRLILTDTEMSKERVRQFIEKGVYGCVQKPYSEQEIMAFLH